jgi:hypothetical protein
MGSGKHLNRSIKKYGIEFFEKEILFIYSSEEEMNNKEKELVTEEYCSRKDTYNICPGGQGGFGYINNSGLSNPSAAGKLGGRKHKERLLEDKNYRKSNLDRFFKYAFPKRGIGNKPFLGKKHTPETIEKMKLSAKDKHVAEKNSQYGTIWITNGQEVKKIKKEELDIWISRGYKRGRVYD